MSRAQARASKQNNLEEREEEDEEEDEEEEAAAEEEEVNVPARRQRSDRAKAAFSLFVKSMSGRRPGRDFRFQR